MPAPPEQRSACLSRSVAVGRNVARHFCPRPWHEAGQLARQDEFPERARRCCICWGAWKEGVMRDGIFIVDGDGHVMDFPHRCYQKYLPEQYRRRIAFFPGAQWDRRQAPNGDMGRDPNTPHEDNILYASDYPHWDSEWPHTVDELLKRDDLEPRVKAKILGQNALRFYDLKGGHR